MWHLGVQVIIIESGFRICCIVMWFLILYSVYTNFKVKVMQNSKAKKMKFFEVQKCQVSVLSTSTLTPVYSILV